MDKNTADGADGYVRAFYGRFCEYYYMRIWRNRV